MSTFILQVGVILFLTLLSGLLAMSEIALVSSRKSLLQKWAEEGDPRAKTALEIKENSARLLSTIQIGITAIGVGAGAFGGAAMAERLSVQFQKITFLAPIATPLSFVLVVSFITFFSLLLGELVPKQIGIMAPERVSLFVARPLRTLESLTYPLVTLLSAVTHALLRTCGISRTTNDDTVTEEEIKQIVERSAQAGELYKTESEMVNRVFTLDDLRIDAMMTPQSVLTTLNINDDFETVKQKISYEFHTYYPVSKKNSTDLVGIVRGDEILSLVLKGCPFSIAHLIQKPTMVPEFMPVLEVLDIFKHKRTRILFVVDEYGAVQGVVTLSDLLQAILGEMPTDDSPFSIIQREDGSWLVDGIVPVERAHSLLRVQKLPGEDDNSFSTLGGFVLRQLGHLPDPGEYFEWNGIRFEVMDRDGNRIDKILITLPRRLAS